MKHLAAVLSALMLLPLALPVASGGSAAAASLHKWKFAPTINAPWAREEDDEELDSPIDAAGLCRSNPFDTTGAYGPLGSNVDVIVGDQINNSGFSNFGTWVEQAAIKAGR